MRMDCRASGRWRCDQMPTQRRPAVASWTTPLRTRLGRPRMPIRAQPEDEPPEATGRLMANRAAKA